MEERGLRLVGSTPLDGRGDTMGVALGDGHVYVGHTGFSDAGTSIVDVRDPAHPRLVRQLPRPPGTRTAKVVVVGDTLLTSGERELDWGEPPFVRPVGGAPEWTGGMAVYDVSTPAEPRRIGFYATEGVGVHRMTWTGGRHAYVTASDDGHTDQFLHIVDLSDPTRPTEAGRWWYPGMCEGGGERPRFPDGRRYALHHALVEGDLVFCGWWDAGLVILDAADVSRPRLMANLNWGPAESGATHTALPLPGRDLLVVTDEAILPDCRDIPKQVRVFDVSDPYSPALLSTLPVPEGDFCDRGGRFGPHNLGEFRPGTGFGADEVYLTYFNAGLRVYDLRDPARPVEVAAFVPDPPQPGGVPQVDDVTLGPDGIVYLTDRRGGGLHILERL